MYSLIDNILGVPKNGFHESIDFSGEYDFYVKPIIQGQLPYENTTIQIQAFEDKKSNKPLRIKCKWFRVINERNYEIKDNQDETYHFNGYDIGLKIRVAVKLKKKGRGGSNAAIVTFGPVELSPEISPRLETALSQGFEVLKFRLLKFGESFINDRHDPQNYLRVDKERICFRFGYYFDDIDDFFLILNSTYKLAILCENHDYKVVTIKYQKGRETDLEDEDIFEGCPKIKKKYEKKRQKYMAEMEAKLRSSGYTPAREDVIKGSKVEGRHPNKSENSFSMLSLGIQSRRDKNRLAQSSALNRIKESSASQIRNSFGRVSTHLLAGEGYGEQEEEEDVGYEREELRIKFKSRDDRDTFICLLRSLCILRGIVFSPMLNHVGMVLDGRLSHNRSSILNEIFLKPSKDIEEEIDSVEDSIQRVLELNKNLSKENDNLVDCTQLLETDLAMSISEFKKIIDEVNPNVKRPEEKKKLMQLERSLLGVSKKIEQVKERSLTPGNKRRAAAGAGVVKKDLRLDFGNVRVGPKVGDGDVSGDVIEDIQDEIEKTNRLNEMLLKKIDKLKVENKKLNDAALGERSMALVDGTMGISGIKNDLVLNFSKVANPQVEGNLGDLVEDIEPNLVGEDENGDDQDEDDDIFGGDEAELEQDEEDLLEDAVSNLESSIFMWNDSPTDRKTGKMIELELEKDMLQSKLDSANKLFAVFMKVAQTLKQGDPEKYKLIPGMNSDAEHILDIFSANSTFTQLNDLENLMILKQAQSLKDQMEIVEDYYDLGSGQNEDFDLFGGRLKEEFKNDVAELKAGNKALKVEAEARKKKIENLEREIERNLATFGKKGVMRDHLLKLDKDLKEARRVNLMMKEKRKGAVLS